jgi:hypothetical protein
MRTSSVHRTRSGSITRALVLVVALGAMVPAASSLAQPNNNNKGKDPNELVAPQPAPPSKTPSTILGTLIAVALAGIVLGVNCIPSKRGHQD